MFGRCKGRISRWLRRNRHCHHHHHRRFGFFVKQFVSFQVCFIFLLFCLTPIWREWRTNHAQQATSVVKVTWHNEKKQLVSVRVCSSLQFQFFRQSLHHVLRAFSLTVSTCLHVQEMWMSDGTIRVDGKTIKDECQLEQYRLGESTRTRARTRGGSAVRAKDFRLHVEMLIHFESHEFCKKVWMWMATMWWITANFLRNSSRTSMRSMSRSGQKAWQFV